MLAIRDDTSFNHEELVQTQAANDHNLGHQYVTVVELLINYNRIKKRCKNTKDSKQEMRRKQAGNCITRG